MFILAPEYADRSSQFPWQPRGTEPDPLLIHSGRLRPAVRSPHFLQTITRSAAVVELLSQKRKLGTVARNQFRAPNIYS